MSTVVYSVFFTLVFVVLEVVHWDRTLTLAVFNVMKKNLQPPPPHSPPTYSLTLMTHMAILLFSYIYKMLNKAETSASEDVSEVAENPSCKPAGECSPVVPVYREWNCGMM